MSVLSELIQRQIPSSQNAHYFWAFREKAISGG